MGTADQPVTAFGGPGVLRLLKLIEREVMAGRFHRPPLGPLGELSIELATALIEFQRSVYAWNQTCLS